MLEKKDFFGMLHNVKKVVVQYEKSYHPFNIVFTKNGALWYFSKNQYTLSNGTLYEALRSIYTAKDTTKFFITYFC